MGLLRVSLFGSVSVWHENTSDQIKLTPVIQELLAYLVLSGRYPHSRDVLAEQFWGEYSQEKARGCLKTALWRLRRALEPDGIPSGTFLLSSQPGKVAFNHDSPHWVDVNVFLQRVTPVLSQSGEQISEAEADACRAALDLYTGDLLEDFYDDWAIRQRERLRIIYLDTLTRLVYYYKGQGEYDCSLDYARRILEVDPLREEIHREVMRLCVVSGQRPQAIQQYEICKTMLQRELDIAPMEETQQLYNQILAEERIPVTGRHPRDMDVINSAISQLQAARHMLSMAQEQFRQVAQVLEGLLLREK